VVLDTRQPALDHAQPIFDCREAVAMLVDRDGYRLNVVTAAAICSPWRCCSTRMAFRVCEMAPSLRLSIVVVRVPRGILRAGGDIRLDGLKNAGVSSSDIG